MATESITHAFYFKGDAATRFAKAVEKSMNIPSMPLDVKVRELRGEELKAFMKRTLETNA